MKVFLSNFIRLFVCSFILCIQPFCLHAQTTVLTQSFKNITDETSYTAISSYNGWSFENCYAAGKVNGVDHFLQVGSGSSPYKLGSVTSPVLGVEGNVVVLVRTSRITIGAKFCVSVEGTGIVSSTEYTIEEGSFYHPSAILIKGCLPSTRIRIEGTNGKFYLQMTKASVVSDAVFYLGSAAILPDLAKGYLTDISTARFLDNSPAVLGFYAADVIVQENSHLLYIRIDRLAVFKLDIGV